MLNITKISKFWCGLLLVFGLLAIAAAPVHAGDPAYNVSQVTFSESGATGQYFRVTADLTIFWTPPTVIAPAGDPMYYYLKFNTSPTQLTDLEFNNTVYDFKVAGSLDHTVPAIPKATFEAYDYPQIHYLHIKTQFPTAEGFAFSEDVVIGPILIDNRAPGGTMTLDPASGNTRKVNVTLSPLEPIRYYWLSESSTYSPIDAQKTDGSFLSAVWDLQSAATPPVQVPIYAWFQDLAGNRSTTYAATATYSYTPTVAIVYNSSLVEVGGNLGFTVDGTLFDWTITLSEVGVASIASGNTAITKLNAASITVNGLKVGTFTVSATPSAGGTTLTSGVINVVQTTVSKTFSLATTAKTNVNAIGFILENTGITTAHELGLAVGNCDLVSRWDEATQSYSSHPMAFQTANNFALVVGKAYFVSVTTGHDFTLTGSLPASKTVNLVTTAKTNVNAIGIPKSKATLTTAHQLGQDIGNVDLVSKWDVATQSYSSHPMAFQTANNFAIEWGNGYFVSVTTNNTQWNW